MEKILRKLSTGYAWKTTRHFGPVKDDRKVWNGRFTKNDKDAIGTDRDAIDWSGAEEFRAYDDDGVLYAHGLIVTGNDFANLFEPLDEFLMPSWGCTELRYKNPKTGQFETL